MYDASINCMFGDLPAKCNIDLSNVARGNYYNYGFLFHDSKNFNGVVKFNSSYNLECSFANCTNFDATVFLQGASTSCVRMFYNCPNFNHPVVGTQNVTNCLYMYALCRNFDMPVTIGEKVTSCQAMFYGCFNFTNMHQPLIVPNNVVSALDIVRGCYNFTSDIIFGTSITNAARYFAGNNEYGSYPCNNWFNSRVEFLGVINTFYSLFYNCTNYNKPFSFPAVTSGCTCTDMFWGCTNYNPDSPISIPEGVTDCQGMFGNCSNFNVPVTIPDSATSCSSMFAYCSNFSQDLYIRDGCAFGGIIRSCWNYHSTISVPNNTSIGIVYGDHYRANNSQLGMTVIVRDSGKVFRVEQVFWEGEPDGCAWRGDDGGSPYAGDHYYDSPTIIPEGTTSASSYFQSCTSYDQDTSIPSSVVTCYKMFSKCSSFNSQITFESGEEGV